VRQGEINSTRATSIQQSVDAVPGLPDSAVAELKDLGMQYIVGR
jgi:hypothetical protein